MRSPCFPISRSSRRVTIAAHSDIPGAARDAQKKGDFAAYGSALQRLDEAITKFNDAG
nr:hypothetical protein [Mycobacterium tuberculosis]